MGIIIQRDYLGFLIQSLNQYQTHAALSADIYGVNYEYYLGLFYR